MRLNSIKLSGFKSFAEPTHFQLPGKLVGVVGPNGCGKSNIIDAVRWVLGESKASELRGESMQDVIFNGSGQRKPAGRASVELVFGNEDARAGGAWNRYAEIAVKRVLTRDGTSSYYINSQPVRRRDVQDVFLGTGLGPRAYAIIGQGTISRIIESRPEELRLFLEEAAGVSKYKERRRETEHRLTDTRENLTRVEDILRELNASLARLEKQAEVAARYRELQQQGTLKQQQLWWLRHRDASAEEARVRKAGAEAATALDARLAELRRVEADLEGVRQSHYAASDALHVAQRELAETASEVSRLEERIRHVADARQRIERRIAELAAQDAHWGSRQAAAETEAAQLAEQLDEAVEQSEVLGVQAREAAQALPALEAALRAAQSAAGRQRAAVAAASQQIQVLAAEQRAVAEQTKQLAARRDRLAGEQCSLVAPDAARLDTLRAEQTAAVEAEAQAHARLDELSAESPRLDQARRASQERHAADSAKQAGLAARLSALKALQEKVQTQGKLRPWLARQGLEGAPALWTRLHVEPGWEQALEAALRERLGAFAVTGLDEAARAFEADAPPARLAVYAAQAGRASATTVASTAARVAPTTVGAAASEPDAAAEPSPAQGGATAAPTVVDVAAAAAAPSAYVASPTDAGPASTRPGAAEAKPAAASAHKAASATSGAAAAAASAVADGLPRLLDRLRLNDAPLEAVFADWLAGVYTAPSLADALAVRAMLGDGEIVITPAGHAVGAHSASFYAPDSEQAGLLQRAQEIESLTLQLRAQVLIADEARAALARAEAACADIASRLALARREATDARSREHRLQVELLRLVQQADSVEARRAQLGCELAETDAALAGLAERRGSAEARSVELDAGLGTARRQQAGFDEAVQVAERALAAAREKLRALEREAQEAGFAARSLEARRGELQRAIETAERQRAADAAAAAQLAHERSQLDDGAAQAGLQQALALRSDRERVLAAQRSDYDGLAADLKRLDDERIGIERGLAPLRDRIGELQLQAQAAQLGAAQYLEQLTHARADLDALGAGIAAGGVRLQGLQAEIDRIERETAALGAVNLAALEELGQARDRKAFLDAQLADLMEAMGTLEDAIRKIDLETRALLGSTFETVDRHFGRMFPVLFGGGTAKLAMTGDEILDAGVQVLAQPPGKKNSTIHLLSGGEKALTAIALVFAIFQLNPAPFCLLDEVDAPLDDANTERYAKLVRQMSEGTQFLFISHNKIAMEMAEQLIGVTMQEQGVSRIVAVDIASATGLVEPALALPT